MDLFSYFYSSRTFCTSRTFLKECFCKNLLARYAIVRKKSLHVNNHLPAAAQVKFRMSKLRRLPHDVLGYPAAYPHPRIHGLGKGHGVLEVGIFLTKTIELLLPKNVCFVPEPPPKRDPRCPTS